MIWVVRPNCALAPLVSALPDNAAAREARTADAAFVNALIDPVGAGPTSLAAATAAPPWACTPRDDAAMALISTETIRQAFMSPNVI